MVDPGNAVGRRRTFVKDIGWFALGKLQALLKRAMLLPIGLDFIANPGQVKVFVFSVSFTHCLSFIIPANSSRQFNQLFSSLSYKKACKITNISFIQTHSLFQNDFFSHYILVNSLFVVLEFAGQLQKDQKKSSLLYYLLVFNPIKL